MSETFFHEVDSLGIVEDHIKKVLRLEDSQAGDILSAYRDVRSELIDRLNHTPGGTFTAQHLRGTLAQVQGAIDAISGKLAGDMKEGAYTMALEGVGDLLKELAKFDKHFTGAVTPINLNAALAARETSNFLVTKYETNLDAYGQGLMTQITNGLFSATIGETSYNEVVGRIGEFFTAEEWKLHRIVRTELHNIYNTGKINGMKDLVEDELPDLMKTLMHPLDARTGPDSKYLASLALAIPVDEAFSYRWGGRDREFMAPPDRPNDRAILVPYREAWGATRGPAFIPGRFPKA